ncbi:MAG: type II toxin-antitoxin system PemK/MazF family toxin [Deltaproteobacteria bacterium]|nr:type II toxin-antitoxin system PemK/MazF family toxin [Deltaproteobacteria bacterium]
MKRGEVRWYTFKKPDKTRPVLVLTRDPALAWLGEVTVAPITSVVRDIPSEITLGAGDGTPRDCAVNTDHLQTVSRAKLGAVITTLSSQRMVEVQRAIAFALGFRRE